MTDPADHASYPSGAVRHRPSWHEYFLQLAVQAATRSTCLRRQVGAVLVRDKRLLATGYNGAPRVLYCTHQPCVLCAKMLINCGVRDIYCLEGYPDTLSAALIEEAGVKVHREELT